MYLSKSTIKRLMSKSVEQFPSHLLPPLVYSGSGSTSLYRSLGRFCNNNNLRPLVSTANAMTVQFTSDATVNRTGFTAQYRTGRNLRNFSLSIAFYCLLGKYNICG